MKIAVPTDDGIMISAYAQNPQGYLVLTVDGGEITGEELRWNKPGDFHISAQGSPDALRDCSTLIVNVASPGLPEFLNAIKVDLITTKEVIITRIIMEYLNITLRRESNTICSP